MTVQDYMILHLQQLQDNLGEFFPKQSDLRTWLPNSFIGADVMKQNLPVTEKEHLSDISTDLTLNT